MLDSLNFCGEIAMNMDNQLLNQLIAEACKYPSESPIQGRYLTQVIRAVAPKLWKENTLEYEDALQQTWLYFLKNFRSYDPSRGSIVSWLNSYLLWRLRDQRAHIQNRSILEVSSGDMQDIVRKAPGYTVLRGDDDDNEGLIEQLQQWIESHEELRRIHIRNRPNINAKVLIQKRLLSETSWNDLSRELDISIPTLSSFFQRICLPLLREFAASAGYRKGES
jgi:Sigma-70 region 2